jgi:hypothetical protein
MKRGIHKNKVDFQIIFQIIDTTFEKEENGVSV